MYIHVTVIRICILPQFAVMRLYIMEIGHSNPVPSYDTGIMKRDVFVIHYVLSGTGTYNGYRIEGPCAYLMQPTTPQRYIVDSDSPFFDQYWIKFTGTEAKALLEEAGFLMDQPVFECPYINQAFNVFREMCNPDNYAQKDDRYHLMSGFFQLLSLHSVSVRKSNEQRGESNVYVKQICEYIHKNYASPINETELAHVVHLSVRYMHRIFKAEIGMPPIRYLNTCRIKYAKRLLSESTMTIAKIAESVGFPDSNYFCCVFQRYNDGISSSGYRKKHQ